MREKGKGVFRARSFGSWLDSVKRGLSPRWLPDVGRETLPLHHFLPRCWENRKTLGYHRPGVRAFVL